MCGGTVDADARLVRLWHQPDPGWTQSGASEAQKVRDLAACDDDASRSTAGDMNAPRNTDDAVAQGVVRGMEKSDRIQQCMRLRGYGPTS